MAMDALRAQPVSKVPPHELNWLVNLHRRDGVLGRLGRKRWTNGTGSYTPRQGGGDEWKGSNDTHCEDRVDTSTKGGMTC